MPERRGRQPSPVPVVIVSPSVHVRLDAFAVLRRAGVHPALLRSLTQLRLRKVGSVDRAVILDARALPQPRHRDQWVRDLLQDPGTHLVAGPEEACVAARTLAVS